MHVILNIEFSWTAFEILELQVSSRLCLVYECNPWYHTQLYSVTHNLILIIKLQTFLYQFQKRPTLIPKHKSGQKVF